VCCRGFFSDVGGARADARRTPATTHADGRAISVGLILECLITGFLYFVQMGSMSSVRNYWLCCLLWALAARILLILLQRRYSGKPLLQGSVSRDWVTL